MTKELRFKSINKKDDKTLVVEIVTKEGELKEDKFGNTVMIGSTVAQDTFKITCLTEESRDLLHDNLLKNVIKIQSID